MSPVIFLIYFEKSGEKSDKNNMQQQHQNLPVHLFKDSEEWAGWLEKNGAIQPGIWLRLARKKSSLKSISYDEAVSVALCYGWIDGLLNKYDDQSWLQRFTPRKPKSAWSKINKKKALALIASGEMKPAGLAAVGVAQQNGTWDSAYDSQRSIEVPDDFRKALEKNPAASAFFETLDKINRYALLYRIQTARQPELRAGRIRQFIEMLNQHQKLYPQKS